MLFTYVAQLSYNILINIFKNVREKSTLFSIIYRIQP